MKALVTTAYGDVDKLTVTDVPEPQIGPGDVKVKVHAASINPMDWRLLAGQVLDSDVRQVLDAWIKRT